MYGNYQYGQLSYGEEGTPTLEEIEHLKPNLIQHIPIDLRKSKIMKEVLDSVATQFGVLNFNRVDLERQFSVESATWGLGIYEKELGIKTNLNQSYEDRREIIKAKWRGEGTTTKKMIINTAEAFSGGKVDVIEQNSEYKFIVKFIGVLGIPRNMQGFLDMLETIKPAHLAYEIKYAYTVWDHLNLTWNQAGLRTWDELRVYEG